MSSQIARRARRACAVPSTPPRSGSSATAPALARQHQHQCQRQNESQSTPVRPRRKSERILQLWGTSSADLSKSTKKARSNRKPAITATAMDSARQLRSKESHHKFDELGFDHTPKRSITERSSAKTGTPSRRKRARTSILSINPNESTGGEETASKAVEQDVMRTPTRKQVRCDELTTSSRSLRRSSRVGGKSAGDIQSVQYKDRKNGCASGSTASSWQVRKRTSSRMITVEVDENSKRSEDSLVDDNTVEGDDESKRNQDSLSDDKNQQLSLGTKSSTRPRRKCAIDTLRNILASNSKRRPSTFVKEGEERIGTTSCTFAHGKHTRSSTKDIKATGIADDKQASDRNSSTDNTLTGDTNGKLEGEEGSNEISRATPEVRRSARNKMNNDGTGKPRKNEDDTNGNVDAVGILRTGKGGCKKQESLDAKGVQGPEGGAHAHVGDGGDEDDDENRKNVKEKAKSTAHTVESQEEGAQSAAESTEADNLELRTGTGDIGVGEEVEKGVDSFVATNTTNGIRNDSSASVANWIEDNDGSSCVEEEEMVTGHDIGVEVDQEEEEEKGSDDVENGKYDGQVPNGTGKDYKCLTSPSTAYNGLLPVGAAHVDGRWRACVRVDERELLYMPKLSWPKDRDISNTMLVRFFATGVVTYIDADLYVQNKFILALTPREDQRRVQRYTSSHESVNTQWLDNLKLQSNAIQKQADKLIHQLANINRRNR